MEPSMHGRRRALGRNLRRDKYLILLVLPVVAWFIIFRYIPMAGGMIAFEDYLPTFGIFRSAWVGLRWFKQFFDSIYFFRLIRNTFLLNLYFTIVGFPIPVVFALMLNELRNGPFKRTVQTVSYLPHFISLVVVVSILMDLVSTGGIINQGITAMGGTPVDFIRSSRWFRTLYVGSGVWQNFGWDSIIYLAAMAGIDMSLYEAAMADGAGRLRRIWHITLPGILPTLVIIGILDVGTMLSVGSEKIILMYSPAVYETSDVLATYVYRRGILGADYSFSAAVGFFESAVNLVLLFAVNWASKRLTESSLW
jgi:putative aldouronate transport system permease protein